jgi:hypothetical protein
VNQARAGSTNLVHQLTFAISAQPWAEAYVAGLYSSISLLSFELEGRSYGGGVLKLETREAERVEIPVLDDALASSLIATLPEIDHRVRHGHPESGTELVDRVLVAHGVIDEAGLEEMRGAKMQLQQRRALRGRTAG